MQNSPQPPTRGRGRLGAALAVASLAVALGAWWLLRSADTASASTTRLRPSRAEPTVVSIPEGVSAGLAPLAMDEGGVGDGARPTPAPPAGSEALPEESFAVIVVDQGARPVPGATVRPILEDRANYDTLDAVITDATGHATVSIPAWVHPVTQKRESRKLSLLSAEKDGVGRSRTLRRADFEPQLRAGGDIVLHLVPDAIVDGLVLNADGTPAAGCTVGTLAGDPVILVGAPLTMFPGGAVATTAEGRFRVAVRADVILRFWAQPVGGARVEETVILPDDGHASVTLHLAGDWWIEGEVLDPSGKPLSQGVDVIAYRGAELRDAWADVGKDRLPSERLLARFDSSGRFRLPAARLEPHWLVASARDMAWSDPLIVALGEGSPRASVTLRLVAPADITGRVITAAGAPLPGVDVRGITVTPPAAATFHATRFARTDDDGRFRLGLLHPREVLDLRVSRPQADGVTSPEILKASTVAVRTGVPAGASGVEIVAGDAPLAGGSGLRGQIRATVRSALTGLAPPQLRWRVLPEGSAGGGTVLKDAGDATGELLVDGLQPGTVYTLVLTAEGHGALDVHGLVASEQPAPVRVELPALAELQVEVVDRFGAAVPYAEVTLERSFDTVGFHPHRPQSTDGAGRTRFTKLDAGRFRVALMLGGELVEQTLDVASGESALVRLVAPAGR
jgi:hypothetical protein